MSSIFYALVPADATDTQRADFRAILNDLANGQRVEGVRVGANVDQPAEVDQPNDVASFFAKPQAQAPQAPALPSVEEMDASGDPLWLAKHVSDHGELPDVDEDNAWHILAALRGVKDKDMPADVVTLRKQANMVRTRYAGKVKREGANGNGHEAPSTDPLAFLTQGKPQAQQATSGPTIDVAALQLASDLPGEIRTELMGWAEGLTDQNRAVINAWIAGDINPTTRKPLTLDEVNQHVTGNQVKTLRRKVSAALK